MEINFFHPEERLFDEYQSPLDPLLTAYRSLIEDSTESPGTKYPFLDLVLELATLQITDAERCVQL